MWANDVLRQAQSNPPWPPGTIVTDSVLAQYADWKQVADDYVLPRDLTLEKLAKRQQINAAKDAEESASPFVYLDRPFDYDPISRERLNVAIQLAQSLKIAGIPGTQKVTDWKLYDNTLIELTVDMLCNMPQAFAEKSTTLHQKAWTLKTQVDAVTTLEEIDAIAWEVDKCRRKIAEMRSRYTISR